jgi:pimeloyl-ACP methyl ester carboxylesterase
MSIKPINQIALKDGRTLGYAEYGDLKGKPVLHFHGVPSSRLEGDHPRVDKIATELGIRLIFPDRPGMGLSDYKPRRSYLDWTEDVCQLADALGLKRFAVVGLSGGGPYAAACAYKIPERLTGAGIISGVGPMEVQENYQGLGKSDRQAMDLATKAPWLLRILFWYLKRLVCNNPEGFLAQLGEDLSHADKEQVAQPDVRRTVVNATIEAFHKGGRGAVWDYAMVGKSWGFKLEDIRMPVHLWHGEEDRICSIQMGRRVAGAIPDCQAHYYPREGHLSVYAKYYGEILSTMRNIWDEKKSLHSS